MDKHCEIEAKFRADNIGVAEFLKYLTNNHVLQLQGYKVVAGTDTYYTQGDSVVRHRHDGRRDTSVFTVKRRKSTTSIKDRHEIDLPLDASVTIKDARAFLRMTGWVESFSIEKCSYIAHVKKDSHTACLALYDVWDMNLPEHEQGSNRFLEVEIEKDSSCSPEQAEAILDTWIDDMREALDLNAPLNESLYEIYAPKPAI